MRPILILALILISPLKVQGTAINYDTLTPTSSFLMTQDTYCMALNIYH